VVLSAEGELIALAQEAERLGFGSAWAAEAVELARALGRLPARTVIYGIEGESFEVGHELTLAVATAAEHVAEAVREEVVECTRRR
jgi:hydrogenase maturation protease